MEDPSKRPDLIKLYAGLPERVKVALVSLLGSEELAKSLVCAVVEEGGRSKQQHLEFLRRQAPHVLPQWVEDRSKHKPNAGVNTHTVCPIEYLMGKAVADTWVGPRELRWGDFCVAPIERKGPWRVTYEKNHGLAGFERIAAAYLDAGVRHKGELLTKCADFLFTQSLAFPSAYSRHIDMESALGAGSSPQNSTLSEFWVASKWYPPEKNQELIEVLNSLIINPKHILDTVINHSGAGDWLRRLALTRKFLVMAPYCAPLLCADSNVLAKYLSERVHKSMGGFRKEVDAALIDAMTDLASRYDQVAQVAEKTLSDLPVAIAQLSKGAKSMILKEEMDEYLSPLVAVCEGYKIKKHIGQSENPIAASDGGQTSKPASGPRL